MLLALASADAASASGLLETATGAATQAAAPAAKVAGEASAPVANAATQVTHAAGETTAAVTQPAPAAQPASRVLGSATSAASGATASPTTAPAVAAVTHTTSSAAHEAVSASATAGSHVPPPPAATRSVSSIAKVATHTLGAVARSAGTRLDGLLSPATHAASRALAPVGEVLAAAERIATEAVRVLPAIPAGREIALPLGPLGELVTPALSIFTAPGALLAGGPFFVSPRGTPPAAPGGSSDGVAPSRAYRSPVSAPRAHSSPSAPPPGRSAPAGGPAPSDSPQDTMPAARAARAPVQGLSAPPSGGLAATAGAASGIGAMMLLTLAGLLVLGAPWTRRRLRLTRQSRWPAPLALIPTRPG